MADERRTRAQELNRDDPRSDFDWPAEDDLPSATNPCNAPNGYNWIRAFAPKSPAKREPQIGETGKWLVRVNCRQVAYCWGRVREATEAGRLGVAAKVATDWHMKNDPAGPWNYHVICVYTSNFANQGDAVRVAKALRAADAVRSQIIYYKPDLTTLFGRYSGNAPGDIAIYSCHPPNYDRVVVNEANLQRITPAERPKKIYNRRPRCPGSLKKPTSITPNSGRPFGACPACDKSFFLRTDGRVWHHTADEP